MAGKWLKWEHAREWGKIQCPMLGNESIMTYSPEGLPDFYTYTAPFMCDGKVCCYRYDHNQSRWDDVLFDMGDCVEGVSF